MLPRVARTAVVATISRLRRTAMTVRRAVRVAIIAVVPVVRIRISHAPIHRARTMQVRRVMRANRMGKVVRRVRAVLPRIPATAPNSAAGTCPMASTLVRARRDPAAIRTRHARSRDVPVPAARASLAALVARAVNSDTALVDMARRVRMASTPDRTSSVHSLHVRTAIVHAAIGRKAACRAARTQAPVATARKVLVPVAIVRAAIIRVGNPAAPAARRRTRVRMARVRIDPTLRAARVMKGCRATRIDPRVFPSSRMQCGR